MSLITRTATIQVRVVPRIKEASEQVLWRLGFSMSEAVELFLRRMIIDQCIPFHVIALGNEQVECFSMMAATGERATPARQSGTSKMKVESLAVSGAGAKRKQSKKRARRTHVHSN
jgi:addiction module RelB/DinJ family antitoxin